MATLPTGDLTAWDEPVDGVDVDPQPAKTRDDPIMPADKTATERRFIIILLK